MKPKAIARPYTPTRTEVHEHEVTHPLYRSWCWYCVFGRGVSTPHPKPDGKENIGITMRLDYCFMNGDVDEDRDPPGMLIIWDETTSAFGQSQSTIHVRQSVS